MRLLWGEGGEAAPLHRLPRRVVLQHPLPVSALARPPAEVQGLRQLQEEGRPTAPLRRVPRGMVLLRGLPARGLAAAQTRINININHTPAQGIPGPQKSHWTSVCQFVQGLLRG